MLEAFPIEIKYKNEEYYTLYFDIDDNLLSNKKNIICYKNIQKIIDVYSETYKIASEIVVYDFNNKNYENPIDYKETLNKWNLLNTMSSMFKMYFEGDSKKRTRTYVYLFSCCFAIEKLPQKVALPKKCIDDINKVFRKQERFLEKLVIVD